MKVWIFVEGRSEYRRYRRCGGQYSIRSLDGATEPERGSTDVLLDLKKEISTEPWLKRVVTNWRQSL